MSGINLRFEHGFPVMGTLKLGAPKKAINPVGFAPMLAEVALTDQLIHHQAAG